MRWRWVAVVGLATGCAPSEQELAMQACREVAAAFAGQCPGGDAEEEAISLQCDYAVSVRDRDALLDVCVPAIRALACGQEGPLPEACEDQLRIE